MNNTSLVRIVAAGLLATISNGVWAHGDSGIVTETITIGESLTALGQVLYAEGDELVPHMTLVNNSGETWIGMQVEILAWNPYTLAYEPSPAGDGVSYNAALNDALWATQGGEAGLHVRLNGVYQCNGVDAASYCTGDVTGQVSNPDSWTWTRSPDSDTYTVMFDPSKLVALDGQSLHVGGYEIEYGSQTENFRLNFTAITAVPEADTWAMLLAGLGMVGLNVRRRKA
jgi:hypothetical protein